MSTRRHGQQSGPSRRRLGIPAGVAAAGALLLTTFVPAGAGQTPTDTTPPVITPTIIGTWGLNGWRVTNTTVTWLVTEPNQGSWVTETSGCDAKTVSVETAGTTFTCTARNNHDLEDSRSVTVKIDKVPPAVTLSPERAPDSNGWFNHTLGFQVAAADGYSGVASCGPTPADYDGPNRTNVRRMVACRDRAGHEGTGAFAFDYDGTPPSIRAVPGRRPDRYGWYARRVRIAFAGKDPVSRLDVCSSRSYRGPDSARASVSGWCRDRAGNVATRTFVFRYSNPLLRPGKGMRVSTPPLLDWVSVPNARRYNVQLWHDGRKVLSRWPSGSQLRARKTWRFAGRAHRLQRGEAYTWYVWPRFRRGYGDLLGTSRFVFVRRPAGQASLAAR